MTYKDLVNRFSKCSKQSKDPVTKELCLALIDLVQLIEKDNRKSLGLAAHAVNQITSYAYPVVSG